MYTNYTRTAIYSRYWVRWKPERRNYPTEKPIYVKPFTDWLSEKDRREDIERTWLYKIVYDEYHKNIKHLYFGPRGCGEKFCQKYKISETEFDNRMIHAATASLSFIGNMSLVFNTIDLNTARFVELTAAFFGYTHDKCSREISSYCSSYAHWWFNSWLYDMIIATSISCISVGKDAGIGDTLRRTLYVSETMALLIGLAFEKPDEVPYLFYVASYYMSQSDAISSQFHMSKAYMCFSALLFRNTDDEPKTFESRDEWLKNFKENKSFQELYSFVNMPELYEKLPGMYKGLITDNDNVTNMAQFGAPFYSEKDVYDILSFNDNQPDSININILKDLSVCFTRDKFFENDEPVVAKEFVTEQNKLGNNVQLLDVGYSVHLYNTSVCVNEIAHLCQLESSLPLRDELCELEYILAGMKNKNNEQTDYKTEAENVKKDLKNTKRQLDKIQTKYDTELQTNRQLKQELSHVKSELNARKDPEELKKTIKSLEDALIKEKTQSAAFKNRIDTLEKKKSTEQMLSNEIDRLKRQLDDAEHLNKLLMNAPEDDFDELTHEELSILCLVKAHLTVPRLDSMFELQKLMPNSEFKFTTNDGKNPTPPPKSYDIFFFCLKFCGHDDYRYWQSQLLNATDRQVAVYTSGKNNIARAIIDRWKILKEKGMI